MYCRNCGKEVNENAVACLSCGASPKTGKNFCPNCGAKTNENQIVCTACGVGLETKKNANGEGGRSKLLIGILACVPIATNLGIHYYLIGAKDKFVINLIFGILTSFLIFFAGIGFIGWLIIWIVNLVFGIRVLTGKISEDSDGNPLV